MSQIHRLRWKCNTAVVSQADSEISRPNFITFISTKQSYAKNSMAGIVFCGHSVHEYFNGMNTSEQSLLLNITINIHSISPL